MKIKTKSNKTKKCQNRNIKKKTKQIPHIYKQTNKPTELIFCYSTTHRHRGDSDILFSYISIGVWSNPVGLAGLKPFRVVNTLEILLWTSISILILMSVEETFLWETQVFVSQYRGRLIFLHAVLIFTLKTFNWLNEALQHCGGWYI